MHTNPSASSPAAPADLAAELAQVSSLLRALPAIDAALQALGRLEDPAAAMHTSLQRARARLWLTQGQLPQALAAAGEAVRMADLGADGDEQRRSLTLAMRVAIAAANRSAGAVWWAALQRLPGDAQDAERAELARLWQPLQTPP